MKKRNMMFLVLGVVFVVGCASNGTFYDNTVTTTRYAVDPNTGEQVVESVTVDSEQIRNEASSTIFHDSETANATHVDIRPDGSSTFDAGGDASFHGQGAAVAASAAQVGIQQSTSNEQAMMLVILELLKEREEE